jgi:hypothetical protein
MLDIDSSAEDRYRIPTSEATMPKYLILYRSHRTAGEQMAAGSPEEMQASLDAWMAWGGSAGAHLVDFGSPTMPTTDADPGAQGWIPEPEPAHVEPSVVFQPLGNVASAGGGDGAGRLRRLRATSTIRRHGLSMPRAHCLLVPA